MDRMLHETKRNRAIAERKISGRNFSSRTSRNGKIAQTVKKSA